jgi:hypothetical protein
MGLGLWHQPELAKRKKNATVAAMGQLGGHRGRQEQAAAIHNKSNRVYLVDHGTYGAWDSMPQQCRLRHHGFHVTDWEVPLQIERALSKASRASR